MFLKHIIPAFPNRRPWLVLGRTERLRGVEEAGYDLVYPSSDLTVWGWDPEYFWIYRPKEDPHPK